MFYRSGAHRCHRHYHWLNLGEISSRFSHSLWRSFAFQRQRNAISSDPKDCRPFDTTHSGVWQLMTRNVCRIKTNRFVSRVTSKLSKWNSFCRSSTCVFIRLVTFFLTKSRCLFSSSHLCVNFSEAKTRFDKSPAPRSRKNASHAIKQMLKGMQSIFFLFFQIDISFRSSLPLSVRSVSAFCGRWKIQI